jgi:hypothetical protein
MIFVYAIISIWLLFLLYHYLNPKKKQKDEVSLNHPQDRICQMLYLHGENMKYTVMEHFFDHELCDNIIQFAEQYAKKNGWTRKRHASYPTTDIEITESCPYHSIISELVRNKIFHTITKMYPVSVEDLGITEMFIAKYEKTKQSFLEEHEDGSEFSFIVALNNEYEGGGTFFPHLNKVVKLKKGDVLIFSGQNTHSGVKVVEGKRYILTGFIHYKEEGYCCDS